MMQRSEPTRLASASLETTSASLLIGNDDDEITAQANVKAEETEASASRETERAGEDESAVRALSPPACPSTSTLPLEMERAEEDESAVRALSPPAWPSPGPELAANVAVVTPL